MWEQIRANQWRSAILLGIMFVLLIVTSIALGVTLAPNEWGFVVGALCGVIVFLVFYFIYASAPESVVLSGMEAREISHDDFPILHNVVEEMAIAAGLPKVPRIFLVEDKAPNAFAFGRSAEQACIAVTTGLLATLTRDELQGVVGHEVAHIKNFDVRFMTLLAVMVGAIIVLSDAAWRVTRWRLSSSGSRSRHSGGKRGSSAAVGLIALVCLLIAVLAPFLARLLYFASSRRREYLADACSAVFTRYPEGLASALEKIEASAVGKRNVNRAAAPLFIINPLAAAGADNIFSTHPPTHKRIKILRSMAGTSFQAYEEASQAVIGRSVLYRSALMQQGVTPPEASDQRSTQA